MDVILAMVFGLVAGIGTALSPCVLPVLPLVLSGAATGGRRRPVGIVLGLASSFAFATLALAYVIDALGLPDGLSRTLAIVVLLGFGLALLVPAAGAHLEAWISRALPRAPAARGGDGFLSGLVLGASLGLLYAPCAGPVLAAVLTLQASQPLTAARLLVGLAYVAGTAVAVFFLVVAGRRLVTRVSARSGRLQQALGAVMVLFGALMALGADGRFRTEIADRLPGFLYSPASVIEESALARDALETTRPRRGSPHGAGTLVRELELDDYGEAPELAGVQRWFNSRPLSMAGLRGRVVLIDFWTYTCINCLRTLPYLKAWDQRYRDAGLTIVGVHAPEFAFERSAGNVARAIRTNGIRYPVVQDNDMAVWNAYANQYWPAKYLVDARGRVRYAHFGEGEYEATESAIRTLLAERGAPMREPVAPAVDAEVADAGVGTPETYLGFERAVGFVEPLEPGVRDFERPEDRLALNRFALSGRWDIREQSSTAAADGARLDLRFQARRVFLVLGTRNPGARVRVRLDGRPLGAAAAGGDAPDGVVRVRGQRLYRLVELPEAGEHSLSLEFERGVSAYAFTFG